MPKIIFTSRYLKDAAPSSLSDLVKYIATRETVEFYTPDDEMDFMLDREIFMKYIAERPGVEKLGEHGLFSLTNEPIDLRAVMKEVADHDGIIWTHIVSLKRDDAERVGYNNSQTWRNAVIANLAVIAETHKIPIDKLRWYGAFHNTKHHPHIHLVVFSADPRLGFLTNKGIESVRHAFADTIFHNEMQEVYEMQTDVRNKLRQQAKQLFEESLRELNKNPAANPELEFLITKLSEQLKRASGKKVYGYLQPKVKATVNQIVAELAKNPTVKKMYDEWCELEKAKHETYSNAEIALPSLEDNKVFKPMKNAIINAMLEMNLQMTEEIQSEQSAELVVNTAFSLLRFVGNLISDEGNKTIKSPKFSVDSKTRKQIREKKRALGLKDSPEQGLKM